MYMYMYDGTYIVTNSWEIIGLYIYACICTVEPLNVDTSEIM